ncbi:MAG: NmrA family NAD(P)-binding protein [Pseudomonadales bacterium]|jgi:uncharacterized protein YbjT (DUF2867 family)
MILITGATGRIGKRVVARLVLAGKDVRVFVRDPQKAAQLLPPNIDLHHGDLADEAAIGSAMNDVEAVLLLSPVSPDQVRLQGNVVKAAAMSSKPYMVKISGLGTSLDSYIDSGRWHAETELQIQDAELPHTFLRPLFFLQNLQFQFESARSTGIVRSGVQDSKIAMIDVEDIAEVVANLLIDQSRLMNQTVTLSFRESKTYTEVALELSNLFGKTVRYETQSLEDVTKALARSGQPQWHIDILLQFNRAFLEGLGDAATSTAAEILGREATTLSQFLQREVSVAQEGTNPFPS